MKITIQEDGGSYGPRSGYNYWSAYYEDGRKINFGTGAHNEKGMRRIVKKWYPEAEIVVEHSKVAKAMKQRFEEEQ